MYLAYARKAMLALVFGALLAGCVTLVANYDPVFDQSLNRLSEDTAKFLASASAGGAERQIQSRETTTYYASTYNVLERLAQRARATRGPVPCPTNATLKTFAASATSATTLPDDYERFDCREFQLYAVRLNVDQLNFAHKSGGTLNASEVRALGGILQTSIMGAIQTFTVNRPG